MLPLNNSHIFNICNDAPCIILVLLYINIYINNYYIICPEGISNCLHRFYSITIP